MNTKAEYKRYKGKLWMIVTDENNFVKECKEITKGGYGMKANFITDAEKMRDFKVLTKDEFLQSYSYLTEAEYDETERLYNKSVEGLAQRLCDLIDPWDCEYRTIDDFIIDLQDDPLGIIEYLLDKIQEGANDEKENI